MDNVKLINFKKKIIYLLLLGKWVINKTNFSFIFIK